MTATDELRKLLDERDIEWESGRVYNNSTSWNVGDSRIIARELADGTLLIQQHSRKHLTPKQAIAVTLGGGMCEIKQHRCTACDHEINDDAYFVRTDLDNGCWTAEGKTANFCPCCGRPVKR